MNRIVFRNFAIENVYVCMAHQLRLASYQRDARSLLGLK